ncbi:MAG: hypothetical protein K2Y08_02360 [Alphaproteobacteria bacterium]|nr:hypothetical protein [Alphaproteobacteria bacterium]
MFSIRKILPSALFLSLPIITVNYSYAMEPDEFPKPKLTSVIATKGEMEELTSEDINKLIINLKEREKDKSKKPIEIRKNLWASLKTPELTLRNLEEALKKYPDAIAILADTLDVKRQQTTMGVDHEGPISQFVLYFKEEEIDPRVRFNVAFSQQKSLPSQSSPPLEKNQKSTEKNLSPQMNLMKQW